MFWVFLNRDFEIFRSSPWGGLEWVHEAVPGRPKDKERRAGAAFVAAHRKLRWSRMKPDEAGWSRSQITRIGFFCRNRSDNDALSCSAPFNFRSCHPIKCLEDRTERSPRALCSCAENVRIAVPGKTPETCSPGSSLRCDDAAVSWIWSVPFCGFPSCHGRPYSNNVKETHGNPWFLGSEMKRTIGEVPFASPVLPSYRPNPAWPLPRYFLSAGLSGAVASAATQPLDVVKTRLQTQDCHLPGHSDGTWIAAARINYLTNYLHIVWINELCCILYIYDNTIYLYICLSVHIHGSLYRAFKCQ